MGIFSKAISVTKSDTINSLPAWEFMNQTGTLGTFLAGSLIYVGGAGDVNVIVAGTVGPQATVKSTTNFNSRYWLYRSKRHSANRRIRIWFNYYYN